MAESHGPRRWTRQWAADTLVLRGSGLVQGAFVALLLLFAYLIYIAGDMVTSSTLPGYYARQSLLVMAMLGKLALVVVAVTLGTLDVQCNTWGMRVTSYSAAQVTASRLAALVIAAAVVTLAALLVGEVLDALVSLSGPPLDALVQFAVACADVTLWALIAFTVATATRSLAASAGGVILYVLAEMYLESRLPRSLLAYLPNWNSLVLADRVFPHEDGGIGIVLAHTGTIPWSAGAYAIYVAAACGVAILSARREV